MNSAAYRAQTTHRRVQAGAHCFTYSLFYLLLDIDNIAQDTAGLRFLSHNKFNLFSFHDDDHGGDQPLRAWAEDAFVKAGVNIDGGRIELLALPRLLGFAFNPISLLFGFDKSGTLAGVIYEVRNTFGEKHSYVTPYRAGEKQRVRKIFHVSPFFDVCGEYRFQVRPPNERLALVVENITGGVLEHVATLNGRRARLSDWALIRAFFGLPLMTVGVVTSIHWQALKLWLRGARYRPKPPPPAQSISHPDTAPLHHAPSLSPGELVE